MTKLLGKIKAGRRVALILAVCTATVGCSDVNDTLGDSLITGAQSMMSLDTVASPLKTYILKGDTIQTNGLGVYYWGSRYSEKFGSLTASFAAQFLEVGLPNETLFGVNAQIDSLVLRMPISAYTGTPATVQMMNVYTLRERLYYDSTYYSNYDISKNKGDLLFSCQVGGTLDTLNYKFYVKGVESGAALQKFVKTLLDTSESAYRDVSVFYKRFPGLYFEPADNNANAAIYTFDVSALTSEFICYYHNDATPKDTVYQTSYYFENVNYLPNGGMSVLNWNYEGTPFESEIGDVTLTNGSQYGVVQGMGGLKTLLKFDPEFIKSLKKRANDAGYKSVSLNRVSLTFNMGTDDPLVLASAVNRLGLYSAYRLYTNLYTGTTSYNYLKENNGYSIEFGGYLNRSTASYDLVITSDMLNMFRDDYTGDYTFTLGADVLKNIATLSQTCFGGSADTGLKPQIHIIYTMIGKIK